VHEWGLRLRVDKVRTPEGVPVLMVADADREAPGPLVLVVHGLRSRKERHLELCLRLARAGFTAAALDAAHHGERASSEDEAILAGPDTAPALAALFTRAIAETAGNLAGVARFLGHQRYGLVGHSMGAYIAFRAAVTDPLAAAVVAVSGNPDWAAQARGAGLAGEAIAPAGGGGPLTHAAAIYPRPLLMLHGDSDGTVPVTGVRTLYERLCVGPYCADRERVSLVEYPGVGHDLLPDMIERAAAWMERHLTP